MCMVIRNFNFIMRALLSHLIALFKVLIRSFKYLSAGSSVQEGLEVGTDQFEDHRVY